MSLACLSTPQRSVAMWRRLAEAVLVSAVVWSASTATRAEGAPYVPASDAVILEHVPSSRATRSLEPLRRKLRARPDDLDSALGLARGYLEIGRQTSDPRFVSYAHATLMRWLQRDNPPPPVLVLAATALQSSHRFDAALTMLDRALAIQPGNAQAWLTKATVLQVQGKFAEAGDACRHLLQTADQLVALTCITSVDSLRGRLAPSYAVLRRLVALDQSRQEQDGIRSWMLGHLGEMAVRLGDFEAAKAHYEAALEIAPDDVYLRAAYADVLLWQHRDLEVIAFLKGSEAHDTLLLRLAIAGQRSGARDAARWVKLYDARRRAARPGENPHLREHARFLLEVRDTPGEALRLAQKNWQVQREPDDVRVYLQAARRAHRPPAAAAVREWMHRTGYEDRMLGDGIALADTIVEVASRKTAGASP